MLSTHFGKPIGRLENTKTILHIIDPDSDIYKKQIEKIKKSRIQKISKCCRYHSLSYCKTTECCNRCPIHYESDSDEELEDMGTKEFHIKGNIIPLPDFGQRFNEYIAGPSGSGKTTMGVLLATEFQKAFPQKKIFVFSRTEAKKDPAYKNLKIKQIFIDEDLLTNPIDITKEVSQKGCLIIFDDCGTIRDDKIRKEVEKLMCDSMEVGRKLDVNMIITNHLVIPNEKKFARTLFNELTTFLFFPKSGSSQQIMYSLQTYFGLSKSQILKILQLDSRWVRISKGYPNYILYSHGALIL